jgi:glycerol-3-phosphate acyltransferase PlsY
MSGVLVALAYLGGAIPVGLLVGRLVKKVDIRRYGSGNIGTTNVLRTLGPAWAAVVFALDAAKGFLPVLVGRHLGLPVGTLALAAALAVAGHNWSVFLRFQGGKGVATSLGALLALAPLVALGAAGVWILVVLVSGYASLGSMLGLTAAALLLYLLGQPPAVVALGVALAAAAIWQHRANIRRLLQGKELRFTQKIAVEGKDS